MPPEPSPTLNETPPAYGEDIIPDAFGDDADTGNGQRPTKYYVDNVEVRVATERVQYLDANGKLIEEAKEKNFSGIVWQVLEWNEPAINFYKKLPGVNFDGEWINCTLNF